MKKKLAGKRLLAAVLAGTLLLGTVGEVYAADGGSSASEAQALTLDTSYSVEIAEAGDVAWFSYTPTETGAYVFTSTNNLTSDGEDELDTYVKLYTYDPYDSELLELITDNDDGGSGVNFSIEYYMTAGTTYYYRASLWGSTGSFSVTLTKSEYQVIATVTDVSLVTDTFDSVEDIDFSGAQITIEYADGSTKTLTVENGSSVFDEDSNQTIDIRYNKYISYDSASKSWMIQLRSYTYVSAATVSEYCYFNITINDSCITAVPMTVLGQNYTYSDTSDGYAIFSFTPEVDGTYYFVRSIQTDSDDYDYDTDRCLRYYYEYESEDGGEAGVEELYPNTDEDGSYVFYEDGDGNTCYLYDLKADTTYYYIIDSIYDYTGGGKSIAFTLTAYTYGDTASTTIDISTCTATLSASSYTYDGTAKTPTVTVKDASGNTLSSSNYKVTYSNNTNVGTATVTITGTGSYTGTITKTFTIAKGSQTVTAKAASSSIKAGKTTTITTSGYGTITYSSSNTSVATVDSNGKVTGKGVGTATITVTAAGNSNYNSASTTVTIKVGLSTPSISSVKQSNKTVTVKWAKVTGAKGYYVYRSTSKSSGYKLVKTITSGSTTSWKDTASKSNGKTYYYKVKAYSGSTKSSLSSAKSIKYMKGTVSELTNTSKGITVKWSKVSGATGYYVYRKASGATKYTLVKKITSGSTVSYTDTKVKSKNGTTYTYYVQPYNSSSKGAYATSKTVRLTAVSISSVTNSASKALTVKYSENSKATGYEIQYSTSSSFASSKTKSVTISKSSTLSKKITKLTKGKKYYVRVRAYKTVSKTKYYSAWSSKKSKTVSK